MRVVFGGVDGIGFDCNAMARLLLVVVVAFICDSVFLGEGFVGLVRGRFLVFFVGVFV